METIKIIYFTDPICTWCWGSEPILRRLETHFPGLIEMDYVLCGLVRNKNDYADTANGIFIKDSDSFNRGIARHWAKASLTHHMPVDSENFRLFSEEHPSGDPQSIAYYAALMAGGKELADTFLYHIRLYAAAMAGLVSHESVLLELVNEIGIDRTKFLKHFKDGSAEKAFHEDMEFAIKNEVPVYPTYWIRYKGKEAKLSGYIEYASFVETFRDLSDKEILPKEVKYTDEALMKMLCKQLRITAEEVRQAFDLKEIKDVEGLVAPLIEKGKLVRFEAGNGWGLLKER